MGIIKRQGIQNSIISYAGVLIGYVNVMVLFPRMLSVEQVGLTRVLPNIAIVLAQLSALGFGSAGIKFFPFFRDKALKHHNFLTFLLGIPLLGFSIIIGLFYLFQPQILDYYAKEAPLLRQYSYYIGPLSLFTLFYTLFNSYLTSLYKTVIPSFTKEFLLRVGVSVCVLLYAYDFINFETFLFLFIAVNAGITLVLLVYIVWLKQFYVSPKFTQWRGQPIRPMLQYGLYAFLGNISSTIITVIDSIMITHYNGLGDAGIYTTATNVASIILIAGSSIYKIASPKIADYWKNNDLKTMQVLYKQVTRINMVVGCLLFIGIWANIHNLLALLPKAYSAGKYVIFFVCAARLFDLASGINGYILLTSPRYRWDLIFNISLALLTIVANPFFIRNYGINGAGFVFFIVYGVINTIRVACVYYFYKMQPFDKTSVQIIMLALLAYVVGWQLPFMYHPFVDIAIRSVLITLVYGIGVIRLNLAPEMTDKLLANIRKI
ncbi:oligosaccharide flippase family protein [Adhaeribacter swui]|uniref:Oligosaccharide flippase family protein n=1 Tax=Adhaeribacter swui TaxID=2086471 RepID=A0A7G7GAK4_9BACT|nr:oligosaccharide flippase family protein [Adhaeribacter swui]QNF34188.1 oligosaccharide flippase family protein [Adhaeribacter swui]